MEGFINATRDFALSIVYSILRLLLWPYRYIMWRWEYQIL